MFALDGTDRLKTGVLPYGEGLCVCYAFRFENLLVHCFLFYTRGSGNIVLHLSAARAASAIAKVEGNWITYDGY